MVRCEVAYSVEGDPAGRPLVLASSLGTTRSMWQRQVAALGDHRIVRYDHRGHGASPVMVGPCTLDDLADDVLGLLDALELERVAFCGTSLGGMVGMWLAANAPERIERLIVMCSAARLEPASAWSARAVVVRARGCEPIADEVMARWFTPEFMAAEPDVVATVRAQLVATPAEGYAACCDALAEMDLRPSLGAIVSPTLVIAGEQDPATTVADARFIADSIRDARLAVIPGSRHLAAIEHADVVNRLMKEHLE